MVRPRSVVLAERLYMAAIVLLVALPVIGLARSGWVFGNTILAGIGLTLFFAGLLLLLTVLVTRRGSRAALWVLAVLTALNVAGYLMQVSAGVVATGLFGVGTSVQVALTVIAVVLLFRPNAQAWMRSFHAPEEDEADEEIVA
jgi:hypothetical protein